MLIVKYITYFWLQSQPATPPTHTSNSQLKLEMLDTSSYAHHEIYNLFLTLKPTSHPTHPHSQLRLAKLHAWLSFMPSHPLHTTHISQTTLLTSFQISKISQTPPPTHPPDLAKTKLENTFNQEPRLKYAVVASVALIRKCTPTCELIYKCSRLSLTWLA